MSPQMMKLEPIEDRKPERARKSSRNWIVQEPGGRYTQAATKLL